MADKREVQVPNIGDFEGVEIIEVLVSEGSEIHEEDSLITLESDKAAMDVPSPVSGTVSELKVKVGDRVSEGDVILIAEVKGQSEGAATTTKPAAAEDDETEQAGRPIPQATEPEHKAEHTPKTALGSQGEVAVEETCDLLVIGAGPGGYTAAFRAADLGRQVVLVERYQRLGGVCLNVGCIPSKALLHAAEVLEMAEAMQSHGLKFGKPKIDLEGLRGYRDVPVEKLTGGLAGLAKQRKVRVMNASCEFISADAVELRSGQKVQRLGFKQAIIAAGSQAMKLSNQPDDPRIMTSTDALRLDRIPSTLLVIGGGIIGLEMATVYSALGSKVTVVELSDGLMPGVDRDLVRILQSELRSRLEAIHVSTKVASMEPLKEGIKVRCIGQKEQWEQSYEGVLVSVGRRPNGFSIGSQAAGVEVDDKGFVPTDSQMRTNIPHIFAIGDIAGSPMLAHKASHEGKVAAEAACGEPAHFDARAIPSIAYTHPEVAWVGVTENEAKATNRAIRKATFPWQANGRALTLGTSAGLTKLLFDPGTRQIIGAGLVGPGAGELIAELVLAIEMGCDMDDIALSVHPHPTLSESIGMAAEVANGTVTDLYIPRKS